MISDLIFKYPTILYILNTIVVPQRQNNDEDIKHSALLQHISARKLRSGREISPAQKFTILVVQH